MRICFVLATAVLLAACTSTEPSGLHADVALDRDVVSLGDSVRVIVTLSNSSSRPVSVLPADAYGVCMHAFEVLDAQGRSVSPPTGFCVAVATSLIARPPVELPPGQRIVVREWWNPAASTLDGQSLPPGPYRVRGKLAAAGHAIQSATAEIEVVASAVSVP